MKVVVLIITGLFYLCSCGVTEPVIVEESESRSQPDCPDYSDSIYNRVAILEQVADSLEWQCEQCYPDSLGDIADRKNCSIEVFQKGQLNGQRDDLWTWVEAFDFIDTINTSPIKGYPYSSGCLQLYDNHIYQVYHVDQNCVCLFFALRDGELFFFMDDEIPGYKWRGMRSYEDHNHSSKLDKLIKWMNESPYQYSETDYERVRNFEKYWKHRGYK